MTNCGYYKQPTIYGDTIVFVSEEDLWTVSTKGGIARRLTTTHGAVTKPAFSPDGQYIAFSSSQEGPFEAHIMPAQGGESRRLTFFGTNTQVLGWYDNETLIVSSDYALPFARDRRLYHVSITTGVPEQLKIGHAMSISYGPKTGIVIGRNAIDPARWKRYRGGTAGDILISKESSNSFKKLVTTGGNMAFPIWIKNRIYFISDHEGVGNIYSTNLDGKDLTRHTNHNDFYVRFPSADGKRIVYNSGGDIYLYDTFNAKNEKVQITYNSSRTDLARKYISPSSYFESCDLHPKNHMYSLITRGKLLVSGLWAGASTQLGNRNSVRYKLANWLNDGKSIIVVSDESGEEMLEIYDTTDFSKKPVKLDKLDLGRIKSIQVSPVANSIVLSNHKNQLIHVNLKEKKSTIIAKSEFGPINGYDFSPDGNYIAYGSSDSPHITTIKIYDFKKKSTHRVTKPVLTDGAPCFDPEGKYLYFLSRREYDPVYDKMHFNLSFLKGIRPYLITLSKDTSSPLIPVLKPNKPQKEQEAANKNKVNQKENQKPKKPVVKIDFENIENRIQLIPVPESIYLSIAAIKGKILLLSKPVEGTLTQNFLKNSSAPKCQIDCYDFDNLKLDTLVAGVNSFTLSRDKTMMFYRLNNNFRLVKAGEKIDKKDPKESTGKESGWVDFDKTTIEIRPALEWKQMMHEAWRLQRDYFWTENMSQIDWNNVLKRYLPLVDRVSTRGEFSDLIWEMQGELGTSHAYESGGDHKPSPHYHMGFLGADLAWNPKLNLWQITDIINGDPWDTRATSPLNLPGLNIKKGDTILAIDSCQPSKTVYPLSLLVSKANTDINISLANQLGKNPKNIVIKPLGSEFPARYREWVEQNRSFVHKQTKNKIGYVHIPDMGPKGFAEFHRYFLSEIDKDGLIVDVRFNGGGHVSQLLLEKLARKRIAYIQSRWSGISSYPEDSIAGPIVALTNEYAGSDGDIFSHCFKLLKIGPLIGKRTWGGVIGISPQNRLVDGSLTTQPEYSFWFKDVGWGVENYGTDPDLEVDILPSDYASNRDPQLETSVIEVLKLLKKNPPKYPDLKKSRPNLAPPKLKL